MLIIIIIIIIINVKTMKDNNNNTTFSIPFMNLICHHKDNLQRMIINHITMVIVIHIIVLWLQILQYNFMNVMKMILLN
eukprot:UN08374